MSEEGGAEAKKVNKLHNIFFLFRIVLKKIIFYFFQYFS